MKKFNFKQISAVLASAMLGITGIAAMAAAYPQPMVVGTTGDFAVVYGSDAATSDQTQATSIANQLQAMVSGTAELGTDSFMIERTGNKFNLGDNANSVRDTLRKDQLPVLLADGTYLDDDNTEFEFTQKIELSSNLALTHFRDSDLDNVPMIGIQMTSSGTEVLNYTMEFQTKPDFTAAKLETTTIELFGKDYFIATVGSNKLTLLDSANTALLNEGETKTMTIDEISYTVSIVAIDSTNGVIFDVNGERTNRLDTGDTYKLSSGAHIGVKDFQAASYAGDTAFVDFSLGAGKLELTEGAEVELNDDTVEGLTVVSGSMNSSGSFAGVKLQWTTSDRAWVTPDKEITLPGFEAFKLSMTEFVTPSEEVTEIQDSGIHIDLTVPLKGGEVTLPLLYHNESTTAIKGIGESDDKLLVTSNTNVVTFNASANHEWFVASWEGSTDAYSEVFRVSSVNSDNETSISALGSGTSYTVADGSTIVAGDVELQVDVLERTSSSEFALNITNLASTGAGVMRNIYTEDGLKIYLPYSIGQAVTSNKGDFSLNTTESVTGHNASSWYLFMDEQDKDQALANGGQIRLTLTPRSATDDTIHVNAVTVNATTGSTTGTSFGTGSDPTLRVESTDDYVGYVQSELASRIDWDKSGDERTAKVTYHGEESYGKVFVSSTDASGDGLNLDNVLVTDAQISAVEGRNLIVVGGSAVNEVAAKLVGVTYPTYSDSWTAATGVGTGQLLIQVFDNPYLEQTGKIAVLVAGYEAGDTVAGAARLINQPSTIDTTVGNKYVYSTGTEGKSTCVSGPCLD